MFVCIADNLMPTWFKQDSNLAGLQVLKGNQSSIICPKKISMIYDNLPQIATIVLRKMMEKECPKVCKTFDSINKFVVKNFPYVLLV